MGRLYQTHPKYMLCVQHTTLNHGFIIRLLTVQKKTATYIFIEVMPYIWYLSKRNPIVTL